MQWERIYGEKTGGKVYGEGDGSTAISEGERANGGEKGPNGPSLRAASI